MINTSEVLALHSKHAVISTPDIYKFEVVEVSREQSHKNKTEQIRFILEDVESGLRHVHYIALQAFIKDPTHPTGYKHEKGYRVMDIDASKEMFRNKTQFVLANMIGLERGSTFFIRFEDGHVGLYPKDQMTKEERAEFKKAAQEYMGTRMKVTSTMIFDLKDLEHSQFIGELTINEKTGKPYMTKTYTLQEGEEML